jgi:hypothetical protein
MGPKQPRTLRQIQKNSSQPADRHRYHNRTLSQGRACLPLLPPRSLGEQQHAHNPGSVQEPHWRSRCELARNDPRVTEGSAPKRNRSGNEYSACWACLVTHRDKNVAGVQMSRMRALLLLSRRVAAAPHTWEGLQRTPGSEGESWRYSVSSKVGPWAGGMVT